MTKEIEQGLHEKLCAFILGEASDEVRAEVERELAVNPELRAERERLEGTIGLVKVALGGGESLSRSAVEILARARMPRARPWHARPSFRIAAGIAVLTIAGLVALRAARSMSEGRADDLAFLPPQSAPYVKDSRGMSQGIPEKAQANDREGASLLAYGDEKRAAGAGSAGAAPSPAASSGENPAVASASTPHKEPMDTVPAGGALTVESLEQIDALAASSGRADHADEVTQLESSQRQLRGLGYAGSQDAREKGVLAVAPPPAEAGARGDGVPLQRNEEYFLGVGPGQSTGGAGGRPASSVTRFSQPPGVPLPSTPRASAAVNDARELDRVALSDVTGERSQSGADSARPGAKDGGITFEEDQALSGIGHASDDRDESFAVGGRSILDEVRRCSPEERERWIETECHRIVRHCRRFPSEHPRDMFFRFWGDNAFELPALDPLSTFSVDVDTASYALARRYLNEGRIPEKAQVRTEEFVNYFEADVPAPKEGTFAIHTDLAPSRFSTDKARWMMRVVVRGKEIAKEERKPLNLTFVVDTSGSMKENGRLELVKTAMRLLVGELDARDAIAIVAFSSDARMILPMTSAGQRSLIESAIFPLSPDGSTNAAAGLVMGYTEALTKINSSATNRVVLLSDGVANTGETDQERITESVKLHREKGIYLNTIGVGMNNHNDVLLEQLADKGDGVCSYVDGLDEARKAIVDRFTGAFETIARDVKIQVEFDPAQVERYRLLGYENRAIADRDFRNDKVDAGEIGAGHQVTALYEIERAANASEKPFATVRLRWKAPRDVNAPTANEEANEIAQPVSSAQPTSFEGAGVGYRRAVIVAQFAEFLRRSIHARGDALEDLITEAEKLEKETRDREVLELVALMRKSKRLILNALPPCDDLCQTIDALRRNAILRCEEEMLVSAKDLERLQKLRGLGYIGENDRERLERENADLELRIKELLRRKLEERAR